MKQLQFLIKPAAGYCNMRCQYCFYRDEQQNRVNPEDCMMTRATAETLIQRCFVEIEQGGFVSFAFQGGEPTLAGLDFFRFFTQTVRKYNQKRVTVQYAIQTNGLAITEEWAEFFSKDHFLVGISLDGTPDVHDALRPDAQGNGTWDKITQTIKLLRRCGVECNLLCVVTKRLAKKAERVYKSMKATGVRYLQFIPCLDPLDTPQGQQNYSLTPELYAQFLCAMFDAWYRDWKTSTYISIRLFEDYIHLLMGSPAGTCSTTGTCGAYMVVEGSGAVYPCDFFCLDAYKLGTVQNDTLQSLLTGKKMQTFITDAGRSPQSAGSADGSACAAAAASATAMLPTLRSAVTTAKPCKSFLPMRNRACARWSAPFKCTAEKETDSIGQEK